MGATADRADAVYYPESDNMGEHEIQRFIAELLRPLIERWLREQSRVAHAGADQFFYWVQGDPTHSRAPDVYVIEDLPQDRPEVGSWKVWEGHLPSLAIEVCGDDWQKDYDVAPAEYDAIGASELVVYDPGATARSRRRVKWQVFRRVNHKLQRVQIERGDRVFSQRLGCFLRETEDKGHRRLRLALSPHGDELFPTADELAESRRLALAARDEELAAREEELAAREEELARLRLLLAQRES